jgi:hypothetical protein
LNYQDLTSLVHSYLDSAGFSIIVEERDYIIAERAVSDVERNTWIIWITPESATPPLAGLEALQSEYPRARFVLLSDWLDSVQSSSQFTEKLAKLRIHWVGPSFFDASLAEPAKAMLPPRRSRGIIRALAGVVAVAVAAVALVLTPLTGVISLLGVEMPALFVPSFTWGIVFLSVIAFGAVASCGYAGLELVWEGASMMVRRPPGVLTTAELMRKTWLLSKSYWGPIRLRFLGGGEIHSDAPIATEYRWKIVKQDLVFYNFLGAEEKGFASYDFRRKNGRWILPLSRFLGRKVPGSRRRPLWLFNSSLWAFGRQVELSSKDFFLTECDEAEASAQAEREE